MQFILICTEGKVTEPECIKALDITFKGQVPQQNGLFVEVIPVPVGGNQGHVKLIQKSNEKVNELILDDDQPISFAEPGDEIDKWLVCDYDELDKSGINLEGLRKEALDNGYKLIVSKPNFEFFVLSILVGVAEARKVNPVNYKDAIDDAIKHLNARNAEEKNFSDAMMIPKYSKNRRKAEMFFSQLFIRNPDLAHALAEIVEIDYKGNFSEVPTLVAALRSAYISQ